MEQKKIKKVLAVICTYNPEDRNYNQSFEDFSFIWFDVIRGWQKQRDENLEVDIVVADDISGPKTRKKLIEFQQKTKDFYIDFIDKWFSCPFVCFNHAVSLLKKNDYDYYAYCASDAVLVNKGDLATLINDMDERCCIISPQADNDMAQPFDFNPKKPPTKMRLGEGINCHLYLFTREFMQAYDYKMVDIIGSGSSESFYTFLAAAIGRHILLSHRVCIHHAGMVDRKPGNPLIMPEYKRDFFKMLKEGTKIGLGYEEYLGTPSFFLKQCLSAPTPYKFLRRFTKMVVRFCLHNLGLRNIFKFRNLDQRNKFLKKIFGDLGPFAGEPYFHNPKCFDENGYAKLDQLYHFIKNNLFLTKEELDYEKIPFKFIKP
jgi:hypothetical protein